MKYTDIKTYEDACKALGTSPEDDLPYATPASTKQEALNAFAKLDTIVAAINDDPAFPDWTNSRRWKYYPWFHMNRPAKDGSGLGLSCYDFGYDISGSSVGSRLVFNSEEKAEYAAKQFEDIYAKFMHK